MRDNFSILRGHTFALRVVEVAGISLWQKAPKVETETDFCKDTGTHSTMGWEWAISRCESDYRC